MVRKRIVVDYKKLSEEIIDQVKLKYPYGYEDSLITFTNSQGVFISALPFETESVYYLIRMTEEEAREIIEEDSDYDEDGKLRVDFNEEKSNEIKHSDQDDI